ncbi:hypothetical protein H9P43_001146 [Blastocladiella emersonii ATCC 22665]|nr:hypothetical protein H9P43_001146 [Blastocladiella emersonii ATCC 22665]
MRSVSIQPAYVVHLLTFIEPLLDLARRRDGALPDTLINWSAEPAATLNKVKAIVEDILALQAAEVKPDAELVLYVNTSDVSVGAALMRVDENDVDSEHPVRFKSTVLKNTQRVLVATHKLRPYLNGRRDSSAVASMFSDSTDPLDPAMGRWLSAAREFNIQMKHISREKHVLADALSRVETVRNRKAGTVEDAELDAWVEAGLDRVTAAEIMAGHHHLADGYTAYHQEIYDYYSSYVMPKSATSTRNADLFRSCAAQHRFADNGLLYRVAERKLRPRPVVVARDAQQKVLVFLHNGLGHRGQKATLK